MIPHKMGILFIAIFPGAFVFAAETLETRYGVKTERISPPVYRNLQDLRENSYPEGKEFPYGEYFSRCDVTYQPRQTRPGEAEDRVLLRVWDRWERVFPGHNPPAVEVFVGEKRVAFQVLNEVAMSLDVWAAQHGGKLCLYVRVRYRHRKAEGIHVYQYNPDTFTLDPQGVVFTKEELRREVEWNRDVDERLRAATRDRELDGQEEPDGQGD